MKIFDPMQYSRLIISLQNYLLGARYYTALKALDFAKRKHLGFRKDGLTPEFQHQVEIALYITTLRDVEDEEKCIIAAILHDVLEDYPEITTADVQDVIGPQNIRPIILLSKEICGIRQHSSSKTYFESIASDAVASIVKGSDRVHNQRTMGGVFTLTKQQQYIEETEEYFLPMLKTAAGLFPLQYLAYMNIRTMLKTQIELITETITAGLDITT